MKTLKFVPELVSLILKGSKTATWRLFDDKDLKAGDLLSLVNHETGEEFAKAKIVSTKDTTLGSLTEDDRKGHESFVSDDEMYRTFSRYYNIKVGPNTPVKIARFELLSS